MSAGPKARSTLAVTIGLAILQLACGPAPTALVSPAEGRDARVRIPTIATSSAPARLPFRLQPPGTCAELMPTSIPAPRTLAPTYLPLDTPTSCGTPTSDGNGTLAMPWTETDGGGPSELLTRWNGTDYESVGWYGGRGTVVPDEEGFDFHLLNTGDSCGQGAILVGSDGRDLGGAVSDSLSGSAYSSNMECVGVWLQMFPDPRGGFAVVRGRGGMSRPYVTYQRFDAFARAATPEVTISDRPTEGAFGQMDYFGNLLVELTVVSNVASNQTPTLDTPVALWLDAQGLPISPTFTLNSSFFGRALLDGSIVDREGRIWRAPSTTPSAAPAWLQHRVASYLSPIRGNRGYAYAASPTCVGLEILAVDGQSCGCVPLPASLGRVGRDGTVAVASMPGCSFQIYPELLK